ncbi:MAG: glycosyltransferase [gamma proteobacterium symbiont of Taylorina sp.]|nr:glycosyltransferase [gamma proteobacterium symbiont of Taylorina sp.]
MIIYIDITQLDKGRANTGIQRVVKEFLQRALYNQENITYNIVSYNSELNCLYLLDNDEIKAFLKDIKNFKFIKKQIIDIHTLKVKENTIFFDMDSAWNAPLKRQELYQTLKHNGFLIFNFVHDIIPVVMPEVVANEKIVRKFTLFIEAVYKYSDLVFFNSINSQNDFLQLKKHKSIARNIPTRVVGLGSDFLQINNANTIDGSLKKLLQSKYILFVGTIEPRKSQTKMLDAFDVLAKKDPALKLIYIGKKGWNVETLIERIQNHPLHNSQLYWFDNIDDITLRLFYENAFIVTYLSRYEGYGLPIAESLQMDNITITSKNSSMYEVGRDFADYIEYDSQNELVEIISLYSENEALYRAKKDYIKQNYKPVLWSSFYQSIADVFNNYEKSIGIKQKHQKKLQFVFISIAVENIRGTIQAIDNLMDFVKEYIVITAPEFINEFQTIQSKYPLTIIDETSILKEYTKDFSNKDHVTKNWLLRASLINLTLLENEFIMLDDDNRPLTPIKRDKFIDQDGSYNCYYFYNLLEWNHKGTDYDIGQQNMKQVLSDKNYELLSYSSHAPQIINKQIFKEMQERFFSIGLTTPIDEWSIYFNYAVSLYPCLFNKKIFQTLNWPDNPFYWEQLYTPENISFENYYKDIYQTNFFNEAMSHKDKLEKKQQQLKPFTQSIQMFKKNTKLLSLNNMIHGICQFKNNDVEFYLSNIPYVVVLAKEASLRLKLNYKLLNLKQADLEIEIIVLLNGYERTVKPIAALDRSFYQESIIEVPIISTRLESVCYDVTFDVKVNGKNIYAENSPYLMKLIVNEKNVIKP